MRFLVDESTGFGVANYIRSLGHDVEVVAELMPEAQDNDILTYAFAENRIIVTNDKDFGELVFRSRLPHRGVIFLRLHDESRVNRLRVITALFSQHQDSLSNRFIVVTDDHVRFRPKIT